MFQNYMFELILLNTPYLQISDISHKLAGNTIVDHSDVVGAAQTTSLLMT